MRHSHWRWALGTFCSGATHAIRRRRLGELLLGTLLGLGSERNMGVNRAALLHPHLARPAGRLVDRVRFGGRERSLFSRGLDGVVRREFCPWKRFTQLWVRHWWRDLRGNICHSRSFIRCVCDLAIPNEQARDRFGGRNQRRARGRVAVAWVDDSGRLRKRRGYHMRSLGCSVSNLKYGGTQDNASASIARAASPAVSIREKIFRRAERKVGVKSGAQKFATSRAKRRSAGVR